MEIYVINEQYIKHLQKYDNRVCNSKIETSFGRKYVGIVFEIKNHQYFAPLSSQVYRINKYTGKKEFRRNFTDIYLFDNKKPIGSIKINNMIPICLNNYSNLVEVFDHKKYINSKDVNDKKYGFLVLKQKEIINKGTIVNAIKQKANDFYNNYKTQSKLNNLCCDYKKLEKAALEFEKDFNKSLKEQIIKKNGFEIPNHQSKTKERNR